MPRKKKTETKEVKEEKGEKKDMKKERNKDAEKKKLEEGIKKVKEVKLDEEKEEEIEKIIPRKIARGKEKEKAELLVPLDEYVKAGIHLGTKVISGDMREYVYRRRADGLAILNTNLIDEKLRAAISFLSRYEPKGIILVCKREAGWHAAEQFSEVTGIRIFTKKYHAGIITNPNLEVFFEPSLIIICDPWLDKNAIHDATILGVPILGLCDTNNLTRNIDLIVPCNNKSNKTLGLVLWILAQGFCKAKGIKFKYKIADFTGETGEKEQTGQTDSTGK